MQDIKDEIMSYTILIILVTGLLAFISELIIMFLAIPGIINPSIEISAIPVYLWIMLSISAGIIINLIDFIKTKNVKSIISLILLLIILQILISAGLNIYFGLKVSVEPYYVGLIIVANSAPLILSSITLMALLKRKGNDLITFLKNKNTK